MNNNQENSFQKWMNTNGYTNVWFYPKNTSVYGVTDMIQCASKAVKLYEDGECSRYIDNIETFIDDSYSSCN